MMRMTAPREPGELLREFGNHHPGCASGGLAPPESDACDCGLTAAIRALSAPPQGVPRELLHDLLVMMNHARIFIASRQMMHPDGIKLWDDLFNRLAALDAAPPSAIDALAEALRRARGSGDGDGYGS
jgi:hypothetical protein